MSVSDGRASIITTAKKYTKPVNEGIIFSCFFSGLAYKLYLTFNYFTNKT